MAYVIKKVKVKKSDGTFTENIPFGGDASGTYTSSGVSVEAELNNIKASIDDLEAEDIGYDNTNSSMTADNVQEAVDELKTDIETVDGKVDSLEAEDINYDNTISNLVATDVQAAIDEVQGEINTLNTNISNLNSSDISYDNTASSLNATEVQSAIDEVQDEINTLNTNINTLEAEDINYDNTTSGMTAVNMQEAIDELGNRTFELETEIVNNSTSSFSVGAMSTSSKDIVITKSGYKVTGLAGVSLSNRDNFIITGMYLTSIGDGEATVRIFVHNLAAEAKSISITAYVIFSKI